MNWIDILFGWLSKGQYALSPLDGFICIIEFIIVIVIISSIWVLIDKIKAWRKTNESDRS